MARVYDSLKIEGMALKGDLSAVLHDKPWKETGVLELTLHLVKTLGNTNRVRKYGGLVVVRVGGGDGVELVCQERMKFSSSTGNIGGSTRCAAKMSDLAKAVRKRACKCPKATSSDKLSSSFRRVRLSGCPLPRQPTMTGSEHRAVTSARSLPDASIAKSRPFA